MIVQVKTKNSTAINLAKKNFWSFCLYLLGIFVIPSLTIAALVVVGGNQLLIGGILVVAFLLMASSLLYAVNNENYSYLDFLKNEGYEYIANDVYRKGQEHFILVGWRLPSLGTVFKNQALVINLRKVE